jgi:hypothetical protein
MIGNNEELMYNNKPMPGNCFGCIYRSWTEHWKNKKFLGVFRDCLIVPNNRLYKMEEDDECTNKKTLESSDQSVEWVKIDLFGM